MANEFSRCDLDETADWDALARFLAGESPPEEIAAVERWLAADPARAARLGALDRLLDPVLVGPPAADVDVEAALVRTRERMHEPPVRSIESRRSKSGAKERQWIIPIRRAAAIAAAVLAPILVYSIAVDRTEVADSTTEQRSYATSTAERDSIVLPDGTSVVLGPETRLTVPRGYNGDSREVALIGEAMFTVIHDDSRPFSVSVAEGIVQDLGTVFSVRTSPGDGARIVVMEGSVRLRSASATAESAVVLSEGDLGTLPAVGAPVADRGAATAEDVAWTRGVLVFRDAPMSDVAAELRRWFGVEIRLGGDELADRHLTATFVDDPIDQIASVIALALGGRAQVRGDTIVIDPLEQP